MKRWTSVFAPSALALAGALSGCAGSHPPPVELQNARAAYTRAESGPAAQQNRAGLIGARQSLDTAERQYDESPDSNEVKTLGYVAQRRAEVAESDARAAATTQRELEIEDRRAKLALEQLGLAATEEPRGTVITLPGANMFATDQAEILPAARGRLTEIAKAVKSVIAEKARQDLGRKIILIGYTDDVGSEAHNLGLSQRRSESVRTFFAQQGLDAGNMEIKGCGESNPVADNATGQGRAKNRRVEIVITPPESGDAAP